LNSLVVKALDNI